jgi:hypothetical protein
LSWLAQKFQCRLEVYSRRPQVCGKRVAEAMPPDCLVLDPRPYNGRTDDLFEQRVRGQRLFSLAANRRKDEVVVTAIWRILPPYLQALHNGRVQRDWFAARFGLGISEVIPDTGTADVHLHEFKINVAPSQCDKL